MWDRLSSINNHFERHCYASSVNLFIGLTVPRTFEKCDRLTKGELCWVKQIRSVFPYLTIHPAKLEQL